VIQNTVRILVAGRPVLVFYAAPMKDILESLSSPVWWFTTVVFGLLINVASSYLKRPIDGLFSGTSRWWRRRSDKQTAERARVVTQVQCSVGMQILCQHRATTLQLTGFFGNALSVFLAYFPIGTNSRILTNPVDASELWVSIFYYTFCVLMMILATRALSHGWEVGSVLKEALEAASSEKPEPRKQFSVPDDAKLP
jgi:hypothetical protein